MEDFKEAFSVNYIYIKEDTKIKKTIIADILTTNHFIRSSIVFITNLNTS
jgi:hypothetical protein